MSDWAKGDLALCIRGDSFDCAHVGAVYTVKGVVRNGDIGDNGNSVIASPEKIGLLLVEAQAPASHSGHNASRFRKIRPSAIKHIGALKDIPLPVRETENA